MNHVFGGEVLMVYRNVFDKHPRETTAEVSALMGVVCYNENYKAPVREKVHQPQFNPKTQ